MSLSQAGAAIGRCEATEITLLTMRASRERNLVD